MNCMSFPDFLQNSELRSFWLSDHHCPFGQGDDYTEASWTFQEGDLKCDLHPSDRKTRSKVNT